MRLELILEPKNQEFTIPLNYQYYLYISFFIIFDNASKEFLEWAKEKGFTNRNSRFFMYNFSFIKFLNERTVDINKATITSSGEVRIIFTSPIFDKEKQEYIINLLKGNNIHFYPAKKENQEFTIKEVNLIESIPFDREMNYKMSSVSCFFTNNYGHFFRIGDPNLEKRLIEDLKYKYELVYRKRYNSEINIIFDKEYIANKKVTKLITMKENTDKEYKIRGFNCPFVLTAEPDMQYIAYHCGLGMKNKFGFGCLEVQKNEEVNQLNLENHNYKTSNDSKSEYNNNEDKTYNKQTQGIIGKLKNIFGL
jgi:CRISPR-associated endoribonuclease Cas6